MAFFCFLLFVIFMILFLKIFIHSYLNLFVYSYILIAGFCYVLVYVLSVFSLYNKAGLGIGYILASIILFLLCKKNMNEEHTGSIQESKNDNKSILFLRIGIFIAFLGCFFRAIVYPPENVDSLVYHLPRAFYYYKNAKVDNFISNYIVANYNPPANAIIMSHFFVLLNGCDILANFTQFFSGICVSICAILISIELGNAKQISYFGGLVITSIPLVLLQAATTQSDLLTTGYVMASVLFVIKILKKQKLEFLNFICLGISIGCGVNSKITAGIVLLPVIIFFSIWLVRRYKLKVTKKILLIAVPSIMMVLPFWYRNYMDWDGDFLAIKASSYLEGEQPLGFIDYVGRIILNIGYCLCGKYPIINTKILQLAKSLYNIIGASECNSFGQFKIYGIANHDYTPYGLILVVALISACCVFVSKNVSAKNKIYAGLSLSGIVLSALFVSVYSFIPSVTRYLLPAICICTVNIGTFFKTIPSKYRKMFYALMVTFCLFNIVTINFYDSSQPLIGMWENGYEEKRDNKYNENSWNPMRYRFKEIIDSLDITEIGIYEDSISGIYPMLHELASQDYTVKSIYGKYGKNYDDVSFCPEAIIYTGRAEDIPEYIMYHSKKYMIYEIGDSLSWNEGIGCIYIMSEKQGRNEK